MEVAMPAGAEARQAVRDVYCTWWKRRGKGG